MSKRKRLWFGIFLIAGSVFLLTPKGKTICTDAGHLCKSFFQKLEAETGTGQEIDFAYWEKKNPDVYAWLRIDGTDIDYPIFQNEADEYYLTHDIEKEENIYGAIYTEKCNSRAFTDVHTVIYGHNMRDGSMFGSLKAFADADYFNEHDTFTIFLPEETRRYQIVAAYQYPAVHLFSAYDFTTLEGTEAYFQEIPTFVENTGGHFRDGYTIEPPLVTLSTCTGDDATMRYLVQGILIETVKEQEEEKR